MPRHCVVPGCKTNYNYKSNYISTFKFPEDVDLKQKWINAINRPDWQPTVWSSVCAKHFQEGDFRPKAKLKYRKHRLVKGAIPSVFHNSPQHLTKTETRPTANDFYEKMKNDLNIKASVSQFKNKIRNLKINYQKANDSQNQIGESVESETVDEQILRICPHFDALSEIFGTTTNERPLYDSTCSTLENETDLEFNDITEYVEPSDEDNNEENIKFEDENPLEPVTRYYNNSTPRKRNSLSNSTPDMAEIKKQYDLEKKNFDLEIIKFKEKQARSEIEMDLQIKKFNLEMDKFKAEQEFKKQELQFKSREIEIRDTLKRMEMEKGERMEKLKLQMEKDVRMEKLKTEKTIEKLKLQVELEIKRYQVQLQSQQGDKTLNNLIL